MGASLGELARLIEAEVHGDPQRRIHAVRPLSTAGPDDLSFLTDPRYVEEARTSKAGALLVPRHTPGLGKDQLVSPAPAWALTRLLERFHPSVELPAGTHPTAVIDPAAEVDASAHVGPHVVIGAGSRIGQRAVLHAGVVVGARCQVGASSVLHPRVVLYDGTELGERVEVHAGAILGSDGFRVVPHEGELVKVPQVGRVVVEDDVEIGANTTIDRAAFDETRIGRGSKLDNLVQVGHNVHLGPGCIICGQAGIAGSSRLGAGVVLAGQSGVGDHVELADDVQVAARGAVLQSVSRPGRLGGIPAIDLKEWHRQQLLLRRLGELFRRVRALEKQRGQEDPE